MERQAFRISGFVVVGLVLAVAAVGALLIADAVGTAREDATTGAVVVTGLVLLILAVSGLTVVNPNQARVVQFFGRYVGSIVATGFHWTWPLTVRRQVSLRVRNFETGLLKVSDADGNPVEIAAVVVWRVIDSAKAVFAVDDHVEYIAVQAETAVRHLATSYPYESYEQERASLRDSDVVTGELTSELRERVELAGIEVLESRVTHLAYAQEIAQAMLARQQASAIVAAKSRIVEGAVGMVGDALTRLESEGVVVLDEERRAQMVSNLLVVLSGNQAVNPVVNAGTLYG